jgi:uncharacterized membrane protein
MAGIQFELKKIFKERSLVSMFRGVFYSTFVTIGPMLIVIICYLLLLVIMNHQHASYLDKDLLASIILYVFIFSLIVTSPFGASISRFISDSIFEERYEDILASYYAGMVMNLVVASVMSIPFITVAIYLERVDPLIMFLGGGMFYALVLVFYDMTYIIALKDFRSIGMAFVYGMLVAMILAAVFYYLLDIRFLVSILVGMTAGFTTIALNLTAQVRRYFHVNSRNYRKFFKEFWKHRYLFLGNFFYIMGLYVHNFVFWTHPSYKTVVAETFQWAPVYDTATFLGMMTNISTMVIFTVRVELRFHEKYQIFCQQVIGGIREDIELAKKNMFFILRTEILFLAQMQIILSIILFLLISLFASFLGFGGMVMVIYPTLAAGYFSLFLMYSTIVFLFYYDDQIGALLTSMIFFFVTFIMAIIIGKYDPRIYGLALFSGGLTALMFSLFRIRRIEKTLNKRIFCRGKLLNVAGK